MTGRTTDPGKLLQLAQGGDATAAAELWRRIAAGEVDDATTAVWARDVAQTVLAKVLNPDIPANRRAELARAALGLEGRVDENAELRELALADFPDLSPAELAEVADLLVDVGKADRYQVRRKIEHLRRSRRGK